MLSCSDKISIRKMEDKKSDYELMAKWLSDPKVLEFYEGRDNPFNLDDVIKKYSPRAQGNSYVIPCIFEYNETPIGYIQYYKITADDKAEYGYELNENIYGIDLFIGETNYQNMGLGTETLKSLIKFLLHKQCGDRVIIDPQTWNKRAISCYEKCGFKPVKVLKKHELHEKEYRDNLLMEISLDVAHPK